MEIRALIVDDSAIMRGLMMRALREAEIGSFTFIEAATTGDALAKCRDNGTQICFLDGNLPELEADTFARALRKGCAHPIPVVLITSETPEAAERHRPEDSGVDCRITKPVRSESLRRKLRPLLRNLARPAAPAVE